MPGASSLTPSLAGFRGAQMAEFVDAIDSLVRYGDGGESRPVESIQSPSTSHVSCSEDIQTWPPF